MAKTVNKLTDGKVKALTAPGLYGDGDNLWLQIGPKGGKAWLFRYRFGLRQREMGLGPYPAIGLAAARRAAVEARALLRGNGVTPGQDPLERKRALAAHTRRNVKDGVSFRQAAERYITAHEATWRNAKHRAQWSTTLETYVWPAFGDLDVTAIDTGLVLKAIEPIWNSKPETASRVRGRIETVLDWASARGYRHGDNPARWRGHLDKLLPARSRVRAVKDHVALDYAELNAFWRSLGGKEGVSVEALRFAILTAARTGEVIGATWSEVDLNAKVWTIPAARMKAGKEHRVPLSKPAVAVLERLKPIADFSPRADDFIFPGGKTGTPLSSVALLMTLRKTGRVDLTAHGFRSTFRDWAAERTAFASEVIELALAHSIKDKTEAAYRRGDLFDKREKLMAAWAAYCLAPVETAGVTPIRAGGAR